MELMSRVETCEPSCASGLSSPTLTARLKGEKERLEMRLAKVNDALAKLQEHPEVQDILDAIQRVM